MANNSSISDNGLIYDDDVQYLRPDTFDFGIITGALLILIFIFSIIGNALLVSIIVMYEDLKKVTNIFILNLACSDLIFTASLPFFAVFFLHHWIFGDFACKAVIAAFYVGLYSSVILLTAMTVDRFVTVVLYNWPSNPVRRNRCAVVACAAAWVISVAAGLSDATKAQVRVYGDNYSLCEGPFDDYNEDLEYQIQVALLFFLPFAIIVFCYSAIIRTVIQASNRRNHRTVVMVLCIVISFFICWGPYHIVLLIASFSNLEDSDMGEPFHIAYSVCCILAYSHCSMNPLLCMLSQKLRGSLLQLLTCNRDRMRNRENGNAPSTSVIPNLTFTGQNSATLLELPSRQKSIF